MSSAFELSGRVCVLTGATGGIGRALAAALAAEGCRLILCGRSAALIDALDSALPAGSVVDTCVGSLTDTTTQTRLAALASDRKADVLINLAGVNQLQAFDQMSADEITHVVSTNLLLPMALSRLLLPMLKRKSSSMIVNVGSVFGSIGHPGYVAYSASKFGLRGFSQALGRELADSPVKVIHIAPRATRTAMNDGSARTLNETLGNKEDAPEYVATRIVRAMQRCRSLTTLGWPEQFFVFINQLMPGIVDKALNANLSAIKAALPKPSPQE